METPKNIYQTLNAVMNDITAIKKSQKNVSQNFNFRGIDQFMNELHYPMVKHGLIAIPTFLSSTTTPCQSKNGAAQLRVTQTIKYTFYALDGSFLESIIEAEAIDTADKASTKVMSSALKYLLMQVFMVPTEDMEDVDAHSPEIGNLKPMVIPTLPNLTFTDVISDEVYAATTKDSLAAIWRKYVPLQKDASFKEAVRNHGEILSRPSEIASAFLTEEDFYNDTVEIKPVKIVETFAQRKARAALAIGGASA